MHVREAVRLAFLAVRAARNRAIRARGATVRYRVPLPESRRSV
jgi:hypothetical protein